MRRTSASSAPSVAGEREREQAPGRDLRVEGLRRRDAHLDVATVGRVEHAVGLVDEVAVAPVDDRDDRRAAVAARSTVRFVSVVVPLWLMATTSVSCMSSRRPKPESSVAGDGLDDERARRRAARARRRGSGPRRPRCPGRSRRRAGSCRRASRSAERRRGASRAPSTDARAGRRVSSDLAAQRLAERVRRLGDLLQQEVRVLAAVDVARRDLRVLELVVGDGQRRAVVREALDALQRRRRRVPCDDDDLPACRGGPVGIGGRLAVEPQVAWTSPRRARRARSRRRSTSSAKPTYSACPLPRSARNRLAGRRGAARADRDRALERRDGARGTPRSASAPRGEPTRRRASG